MATKLTSGEVQSLSQEVYPYHHIMYAKPKVSQNLHPLQSVDL